MSADRDPISDRLSLPRVIDYGPPRRYSKKPVWLASMSGVAIGYESLGLVQAGSVAVAFGCLTLARSVIRLLLGGFPFVAFILGAYLFSRYPLNEVEHEGVQSARRDRTMPSNTLRQGAPAPHQAILRVVRRDSDRRSLAPQAFLSSLRTQSLTIQASQPI